MEVGFSLSILSRRQNGHNAPPPPPPPPATQTIAARWGTANTAGQASFDTGFYAGLPTPSDGTYHTVFDVTGGVISLNAAPTAGTYDVDGVTVEVDANWKAVGNQSEYNALTGGDLGAGKKIIIREGAAIVDTGSGLVASSGNKLFTTFEGDGDARGDTDATGDARRHFSYIHGGRIQNLRLVNLRISVTDGTSVLKLAEVGGTPYTSDIHVEKCALISGHPDPAGDYSAGWPFGLTAYNNTRTDGYTLKDCYLKGGSYGLQTGGDLWTEIIGCEFDLCYNDFIQEWNGTSSDSDNWLIAGNKWSRPMSLDTDPGSPHSDYFQMQSAGERILEWNTMQDGNGRGAGKAQVLFSSSGGNVQAMYRAQMMVCDDTASGFSNSRTKDSIWEYCLDLPDPRSGLPMISDIRYGETSISGTNLLENSVVAIGGNVSGSVIQTGNVDMDTWNAATWDTNFPNRAQHDASAGVLTHAELLAIATPAAGQSAAGKGPAAVITLGGSGELSDYTCSAAVTPTLTSITPTPTTTGFSACTVSLNTVWGPVFWAVVPAGTTINDINDIKKRRISGALTYGTKPVPAGATSVDLGAVTGLSSATTYDLVLVQWDGWTKNSGVVRQSFQTL